MSATQPLLSGKQRHHDQDGLDNDDDSITVERASPSPPTLSRGYQYQSINNPDPDDPLIMSISSEQGVRTGEETRLYKRRWYILIIFSLMAASQGCVWNTFGPISSTVEDAFGWDTGDISLLTNWGPISFIVATGPLMWILERKGLRAAGLLSAFFIAAATVCRIFTMEPPTVTIMMNVGQALNGLAGPLAMAGPPALSAAWFPPHQRTTATAIGGFFGMTGTAAGFLIGPMLVPDVPADNSSQPADFFESSTVPWPHNETKAERIAKERKAIHRLMYIECAWTCAVFLAMLIYFPKKPPLPPSPSAALQREDFLKGLKRVLCCPQFWILAAVYGLSQGVLNCWSSVVDVLLKPHNIGETEAGWIAFSATCGGSVMSILTGVLADHMKRVMKWIVFLFYLLGTAGFIVFTMADIHYIPCSTVIFTVAVIGGTTAVYASTPLVYELVCEAVYPAGEGLANGVLTLINNISGGVFLLIMMDPSLGKQWADWALVGACAQTLPLLLILKVRYNRLDLDDHNPNLDTSVTVRPPSPPPAPPSF